MKAGEICHNFLLIGTNIKNLNHSFKKTMLHAADMFLKNSGIEAMHLLNINKLFMQAFEALFNLEYTPIS